MQEYVLINQKVQQVEVYRRIHGWVAHTYGPGEGIELMSLNLSISLDELYSAVL